MSLQKSGGSMKDVPHVEAVKAPYEWLVQPFIAGLMASDSPCAIVAPGGVVTQVNAAFARLAPHSEGRQIGGTFFFGAGARKPSSPQDVLYYDTSGTLVPATLHTLFEEPDGGERLILLADGGPMRSTTDRQLDAAPLVVMRVCVDGIVRFANAETYRALSLTREQVIGRSLDALFGTTGANDVERDRHCAARLASCFGTCKATLEPVTLDVAVARYTDGECDTARMRMIPDLGPDGRALGILAVIELTLEDRVRARIGSIAGESAGSTDATDATDAANAARSWQDWLGLVLQQVGRLVKFEHANFGMYADDVTLFRAFMLYPPDDRFRWKERWLALPAGMKAWAMGSATVIADINDFLDAYPDFKRSEVARMYKRQGIRASVTLVAKDAQRPTSALTLCSSTPGFYTQRDVEVLRNLNLESVLIRIEEQIVEQRMRTADKLIRDLPSGEDLSKIACEVVDELAVAFQWEYVSLYRVDRLAQRFELFHESDCPKAFRIEPGYTQGLDEGMLGKCLERDETLIVNDVGNDAVEQYEYIGLGRDIVRSAMTIPMHLTGRIRWMLHIESREAHAFHGPDCKSIAEVVKLLEEGLRQRAVRACNEEIIEITRQGIVLVGMEGAILRVNEPASRLLGLRRHEDPARTFISDYASKNHPASAEILSGYGSTERRRVELQGEDGQIRSVLATRRVLDGSFDTAIWFLIDLDSREWEVGMRFLRATAADVAQQTRAPLALAADQARQLQALHGGGTEAPQARADAGELATRLLAEIRKADITFERLAKSYEIRRYPLRHALCRRTELVHSANGIRDELPARDRKVIRITPCDASFEVDGDTERLEFVIRSLLAHMLRMRAAEQCVTVAFASADDQVKMRFGLSHAQPVDAASGDEPWHDVMWRAFRAAREDACLALNAVKRVVKAHGGTLEMCATEWANDDSAPPWVAFDITLPALRVEELP
jgi:PAS domain-containing protein